MRTPLLVSLIFTIACSTSPNSGRQTPAEAIREVAYPVTGAPGDYDALLAATGNARVVLLGEATHGTHEFYVERARITERLIREKGFTAVALEADWSDAARVDRFVRGASKDRTAEEALGGFERFPRWMWRNREFAALVQTLRAHNESLPAAAPKVRVLGLDLYGVSESVRAASAESVTADAAAAKYVEEQYRCFDRYAGDPRRYGEEVLRRASASCEEEAEAAFSRVHAARLAAQTPAAREQLFSAEQHARVVRNGERYYREDVRGRVSTWNLRDLHMVETMEAISRFLQQQEGPAGGRVVVWAHNSHVGDARATDRKRYGEWNIGQLVRERLQVPNFSVGFSTFSGTVMAASAWGGEPEVKRLNDALRGSHGAILHEVPIAAYYIILRELNDSDLLRRPRHQRAVGVIYIPYGGWQYHYFEASLREQFDAVIHIDLTSAVEPLESGR